jgi:2-phosphoglycerate kinase
VPTDLKVENHPVIVRDTAGLGLPFSRGLMATSVLATGAETAQAYAIAAEIQRKLALRGRVDIEAGELAEIAAATIEAHAGLQLAKRYQTWRKLRHDGRPLLLVLGGAPGVGKSTISTRLAVRFGITRIVTTDTIREVLRTVIPPSVLPELHVSTYESVGGTGSDPADVYLRQARVVGGALVAVVRRLLTERRSVIIEGVHLLPGELLAGLGDHPSRPVAVELMLILEDAELHRAQLAGRSAAEPGRAGQRSLDQFATIRALHDRLAGLARAAGVESLDLGSPDRLTERLLELVFARAALATPS